MNDSINDPGPTNSGRRTALGAEATRDISGALNPRLADALASYMKTKNFHWHMWGTHFRDYHLLLDEQADKLFSTTDPIAERVRKIGGQTLRSLRQVTIIQRIADSEEDSLSSEAMPRELHDDNLKLASFMRDAHAVCDRHNDVATASLLENWIDEAERRVCFLREAALVWR